MLTSEVVRQSGVSRDTLRFYEAQGVISSPPRTPSGYRDYPDTILQELRFIRLGQSVGLKLADIAPAIPHLANPQPGCPILGAALKHQLSVLEGKLDELMVAKQRLQKWIAANEAARTST